MATKKKSNIVKKVAIYGSCVTRDIFNSYFNKDYKNYFEVVCFQNQSSIMNLMTPKIDYDDLDLAPLEGWDKKSVKLELDRVFLKELISTKPDILIFDFFADARFKVLKYKDTYITANEWKTTKTKLYKKLYSPESEQFATLTELKEAFLLFKKFIEKKLPNIKIVLNQARGVKSYTKIDGNEEYFNENFINRLNKRWDAIDNLFISVFYPTQIDAMTHDVKGNVNHLWSISYVHYTSNFYELFLKILISIAEDNLLDVIKQSLARLAPVGVLPKEKEELVKLIRTIYIALDTNEKEYINSWLNGRYKEFLNVLLNYNTSITNFVKFASFAFRGNLKKVVAKDLDFIEYLLELVMNKRVFAHEKIPPYAYLNYGNILFHKYKASNNELEKKFLFNKSIQALIYAHNNATTAYVKNRSSLFLTELFSLNKNFTETIKWYNKIKNLEDFSSNLGSLLFNLLMSVYNISAKDTFVGINKILTKKNIDSIKFWQYFKKSVTCSLLKNNIDYIIDNLFDNRINDDWKPNSTHKEFFNIVSSYINCYSLNLEADNIEKLKELYTSSFLTKRAKSNILIIMANRAAIYENNISVAVLMISESVNLYYADEKINLLNKLILNKYAIEIQNLLFNNKGIKFNNRNINKYIMEQSRGKGAWNRFLKNGFSTGYIDDEIDFLEFLLNNSTSSDLINTVKTRLAYLYYTGTAGKSDDNFIKPDYKRAKELFSSVTNNKLVNKYLKHPRLSIYQDMIKKLDNIDEAYLFFENKRSNKLLIVFSCAGSYSRYTQLKVFYKQNKTNVLFLNNPKYNWYLGKEWIRIKKIIEEVGLKNFKKENITVYFGSMGGYIALRVGLEFGFKTIVFNPQIDLNIWIKHRLAISVRLGKEKLVNLQDISIKKYEQTPIYYATSLAIEDVEAFEIFINKISKAKNGLFIIEKIEDNIHEGIFGLIYGDKQQEAILNISNILDEYCPSNESYKVLPYSIDKEYNKIFWKNIIDMTDYRIIIQVIKGVIRYSFVESSFLKELSFSKKSI